MYKNKIKSDFLMVNNLGELNNKKREEIKKNMKWLFYAHMTGTPILLLIINETNDFIDWKLANSFPFLQSLKPETITLIFTIIFLITMGIFIMGYFVPRLKYIEKTYKEAKNHKGF